MDRSDPRIAMAVHRHLSLEPTGNENSKTWEIPPDYGSRRKCPYSYSPRTLAMLGYAQNPRVQRRARAAGGYAASREIPDLIL